MEGNLRFKIDLVSFIVGRKFTVVSLFYFVFEGNFPSTSPRGGLYLEGRFNGGFFALRVWEGLIFGILRYYCSSLTICTGLNKRFPCSRPGHVCFPSEQVLVRVWASRFQTKS